MMSQKTFGLASLVFLFAMSHLYSFFRFHFSGLELLQDQVVQLQSEVHRQKLKTSLAKNELQDFQQNVAVLLPSEDLKSSYRLRNLASVVTKDESNDMPIDFAKGVFLRGKTAFLKGEFEVSNQLFSDLLSDFPASLYIVEANFLLIEGLYKSKKYEACLSQIESMITLFPENELSGYAMLRLGSVFQMRDRLEEAVEVYHTVINQFPQNEVLQSQAKLLLSQVEL